MIELVGDTRPFFRTVLSRSIADLRISLDPLVEAYVVVLLEEMGRTPYHEEPLGPRMLSSVYPERTVVLKDVGDRSLFFSGFLEERLKKRGLSPSYYVSLCAAAYSELGRRWPNPFERMATQVGLLQRALRGVRDACDAMGMDAWSAAEAWLQTRTPALERRLLELGLVFHDDGEA